MRTSEFLLATLKETPADAEIVSHQLMLRAGLIRKTASGIYTWLPLGLRVLRKVEAIVREEMDRIKGLEIMMPALQPAELWLETQRWEQMGDSMLRLQDRHEHDYCLGPTHEEIITDLARREIRSYKQLPAIFYQIQIKYRDEIRPRFGVMRAREFLMKDAYSFHLDSASLEQTYETMYEAYTRIFTRLGLKFRAVLADTGNIGGNASHEFQVLADAGEDVIAYSDSSHYAANLEKAESLAPQQPRATANTALQLVDTPNARSIQEVSAHLKISNAQTVKTLLVAGAHTDLVALILRGDHELNPLKAEKLEQVASPLRWATEAEINAKLGCAPGSIGVVNLNIPVIADRDAAQLADFCCGANQNGKHYLHVNWGRDAAEPMVADLRNAQAGDLSPDGQGRLQLTRGIEVGHIFQLGDKYSRSMGASVLGEDGAAVTLQMGCYGIGVSRIVGAAIEQHHDNKGIVWPEAMAPFTVTIVPIHLHKAYRVKEASEKLYAMLQQAGITVLFDDRKERPGVLIADMDLIGIPHHLIVSEKALDKNEIEYKHRNTGVVEYWPLAEVMEQLRARVGKNI